MTDAANWLKRTLDLTILGFDVVVSTIILLRVQFLLCGTCHTLILFQIYADWHFKDMTCCLRRSGIVPPISLSYMIGGQQAFFVESGRGGGHN